MQYLHAFLKLNLLTITKATAFDFLSRWCTCTCE